MKAHYGYQSTVEPPTPPPALTPNSHVPKEVFGSFEVRAFLATLSGKLETDHVLLVFFLGCFFFLIVAERRYSDGTVVLDL